MKTIKFFIPVLALQAWLFCASTVSALSPALAATQKELNDTLQNDPIVKDLNTIIDFLSAGVGIVVVGTIILGGIQYATAGNSPEAVGKAKQRIINGLLALALFILIYSLLQWIVPGGIFN